ncbi:uncharacterized protein V1510DRAFT_421419 [Dipodascopsis tothii]|uniref:uncharacterized protein n=1 Tax=Dipodascopsis tothii TaxID=44089 RepID=UPI0034CF3554
MLDRGTCFARLGVRRTAAGRIGTVGLASRLQAFSTSPRVWSEVNPSNPHDIREERKVRVGAFVPALYRNEPIDTRRESLSVYPIYTAPSAFHVAATKRVAWTFAALGSYFASVLVGLDAIPSAFAAVVGLPLVLPLPAVLYLTTPYVSRIYRLYDQPADEAIDMDRLVANETLVFECITVFGKAVYNCRVPVRDLRRTSARAGWVNLELVQPAPPANGSLWDRLMASGRTQRSFYVADDIGGHRMNRIWALVDRQSGVDRGRHESVDADGSLRF